MIHLTQPHLIDSILEELGLQADNTKAKSTPAASSKLLGCHDDAPSHNKSFHYRCIIGKLIYLEKSTQPDISTPHTNVPAFLQTQSNLMQMQSSG